MNDSSKDFSDDPRLTAYALGELEGADRAAIEALVRSNPAAAAAVEEIRRVAGSLADALKEESIDLRPAAEVIPIAAGRSSFLRRLQPYFYVASGLAAGWATALLIFRPAPSPRAGSSVAAVQLLREKEAGPMPPAAAPNQILNEQIAAAPSFLAVPVAPTFDLRQEQARLPAVSHPMPVAAGAIVDSAQLRDDLKHFELAQPALGAGKRIALEQRVARQEVPTGAKDTDVVKLSPFEVTSDTQGYYTANTLAGTRLNSKLSDLGGQIHVVSKEQMVNYAAGIPNLDSAHLDSVKHTPVVYGHGELLPLAGTPETFAHDKSRPQTLAGTQMGKLAAAFGGVPPSVWAPDPLRRYKDQLRALKVIDGTQAGQPALPGEFSQLYPVFLLQGSRAAYERMMADSDAKVAAMGALCLMTVDPAERAGVLAKMSLDLRPITYVRAGSGPQSSTLGALFQSIAADPGFLFPLGTAPQRP